MRLRESRLHLTVFISVVVIEIVFIKAGISVVEVSLFDFEKVIFLILVMCSQRVIAPFS